MVEINEVLPKFVVMAMLLEAIVQTAKPIWQPEVNGRSYYVTLIFSMLVSVGINYLAGLDLFSAVGVPLQKAPLVAVIFTGFILSRGANVVHDLINSIMVIRTMLMDSLQKH